MDHKGVWGKKIGSDGHADLESSCTERYGNDTVLRAIDVERSVVPTVTKTNAKLIEHLDRYDDLVTSISEGKIMDTRSWGGRG